ncbi:MAG: Stp1/IreP family PP2C-type Ser/Thr phosphatase [Acidimicrobiia bacterium]
MIALRWGSASDVGQVRANNQDSRFTADELFAVADGMGGHRGGEVASSVALEALASTFVDRSPEGLRDAAREANTVVFEQASDDPELQGMGTTLVAVATIDGASTLAWVNVGDSRLYLFRGGELLRVSQDHSLVEEAVRSGELSAEEARDHPQRHIVTRALGIGATVDVDVGTIEPSVGDRLVLCSDGLYDAVEDERIAGVLQRLAGADDVAAELVRLANVGGGRDNITVVVVDVFDDQDPSTPPPSSAVTTTQPHPDLAGFTTAAPAAPDDARTSPAADPPPPPPPPPAPPPPAKPKRFTWRVFLFLLGLFAVIGGGLGFIAYQARNSYFVGYEGDRVAIFKGRPGGLLWFDPTFEADGDLVRASVPASRTDQVGAGHTVGSVGEARQFIDNLRQQYRDENPPTTTTTTTTAPGGATTTSTAGPAAN